MSEYDDWKQENDRWEAYLYPNGVLRNKLGITKAAKWHKMERDFVTARNTDRNIPAHAGKTMWRWWLRQRGWEHPRVRGEKPFPLECNIRNIGTSPRARGKTTWSMAPMVKSDSVLVLRPVNHQCG